MKINPETGRESLVIASMHINYFSHYGNQCGSPYLKYTFCMIQLLQFEAYNPNNQVVIKIKETFPVTCATETWADVTDSRAQAHIRLCSSLLLYFPFSVGTHLSVS